MIILEGKDPKMIANNLKPFKPTHPGEEWVFHTLHLTKS